MSLVITNWNTSR